MSGPLESDIGKVRDMSEIATEHNVYYHNTNCKVLYLSFGNKFMNIDTFR